MPIDYFKELGYLPNSTVYLSTDIQDIDTQESLDVCLDPSEEHFKEFHICPEQFFDKYKEDSPKIIASFLNVEMAQSNPHLFINSYHLLLREFCFSCEKEIQFNSLLFVIRGNSKQEGEEMLEFFKSSKLDEQTYKRFKILDMLDKWELLEISLE